MSKDSLDATDTPVLTGLRRDRMWRVVGVALGYRVFLTLIVGWWITADPLEEPIIGSPNYHDMDKVDSQIGELFVKYDSYWYLNIAAKGYQPQGEGDRNIAFLPAYPLMMRGAGALGISPVWAGLAISHVCMVVIFLLAYKLADAYVNSPTAEALVYYLAVFPSSWVLQMLYTESLFCAVLGLLFVTYFRRNMMVAASCALALPWIRAAGLAAVAALMLDAMVAGLRIWQARRVLTTAANFPKINSTHTLQNENAFRFKVAVALAGLMGVVTLGLYYWQMSGHFFGYLEASSHWSTRYGTEGSWIPLVSCFMRNLGDPEGRLYLPLMTLYLIAAAGHLAYRRDLGSYFSAIYILMLLGSSYTSLPRYLLPLLPAHLFIVAVCVQRGWFYKLLPLMAVIQIIMTRLYVNWQLVV